VEAVFSGIPVLLSKNGFNNLFENNSVITFDPLNINELCALIQKYINSEKLRQENMRLTSKQLKDMDLNLFTKRLVSLY